MPIEIVILLLVAVAGIAGSIVLLVFNASLQRAAADGPQDEAAFFADGLGRARTLRFLRKSRSQRTVRAR